MNHKIINEHIYEHKKNIDVNIKLKTDEIAIDSRTRSCKRSSLEVEVEVAWKRRRRSSRKNSSRGLSLEEQMEMQNLIVRCKIRRAR
jgi:hypothetical protein